MVLGIFGESCTGKSTLAEKIKADLNAEVYSGKDYLRLAKDENTAKKQFQKILKEAVTGDNIIYVISEKEHMSLLPEGSFRVLVTADIDTIKQRFGARMRGNLPAHVAQMLERKHGSFDNEPYDIHIISGETNMEDVCAEIINRAH